MASRRDQKQFARQQRLAAEQAASAQAARQRRLMGFGAIVAIAAIAIAVVIAAGGGAAADSGLQPARQAAATYRQVQHELAGIPQHGVRLGDPRAKVTMTYIGDLECPYCRVFTTTVLPRFIGQYVRTGRVKMVYRSLCTATCHSNGSRFAPQQVAAYAAGRQGLFWQYAELFYREQEDESLPYATEHFLRGLAGQIPTLNRRRWLSDRRNPAFIAQLGHDQSQISRAGIPEQTPEVLMRGPRGSVYLPVQAAPTLTWLIGAIGKVS